MLILLSWLRCWQAVIQIVCQWHPFRATVPLLYRLKEYTMCTKLKLAIKDQKFGELLQGICSSLLTVVELLKILPTEPWNQLAWERGCFWMGPNWALKKNAFIIKVTFKWTLDHWFKGQNKDHNFIGAEFRPGWKAATTLSRFWFSHASFPFHFFLYYYYFCFHLCLITQIAINFYL